MVKKAAHATPNRLLRAARKERGWTQQQVADLIESPLALNISRWESGTAQPSVYYLERLCQLFGKSARELGLSQFEGERWEEQAPAQVAPRKQMSSSGLVPTTGPEAEKTASTDQHNRLHPESLTKAWTLPSLRNLFFLGREEVLTQLRDRLQAGQTIALSQPQAISGLGGVGKTQVALEYAYRHMQNYQALLWARADSRDSLVASFLQMADALVLPERDEQNQSAVVAAVKGWLRQHSEWLLILDNADELALLPEFLPAPIRGHLLLTTRAQALGQLAQRIEIEPLDSETAALLLLRRARLLALDAPLAQAEQTERQAAIQLALELGGLPLALDQAGAYLEEAQCSLQQYLNLYQSHRADLLRQRGGLVFDHPDSVATTFALSFACVQSRSALAADVLRLCAVLHPDAIPEELFRQGATSLGPELAAIEADPLAFNQALAVIGSYSLLRRNSREQTLSMHRVVQAVLTDAMSKEEHKAWTARAIAALDAVFPEVRDQVSRQWNQCARLLPHVLTVAAANTRQRSLQLGCVLTKMADYLLRRAQYQQAEPLYQRALSLYEQLLGNQHPQVAFPLNGLADLSQKQVQYEQAERLYQRALCLGEQQMGLEHSHVPYALTGLAELYRSQGKYAEAESLFLRALSLREQQQGLEHPLVANSLNNLANLYFEQGKYVQAEPLYQQALCIWEQQAGLESHLMAYPFNGLAELYREQGSYTKAEPLYQRALRISEQQMGLEHPDVAYPLNNLAELYREQGRYAEAEPLFLRARRIWEQRLGPEHPLLAYPLNGLASLYREQGKYAQAEPLLLQALRIRERGLGLEHPETAGTLHDFARLQELQNQLDQALTLYQQALAIRAQYLGPEHPRTQDSRTRYLQILQAYKGSEPAAADQHGGEKSLAKAWAERRTMTPDQAQGAQTTQLKAVSAGPAAAPEALAVLYPDGLTAREVEVLRLVAQGLSNAEIAEHLIISLFTVKAHMRSLYNKLGISSRSVATRYAIEQHLL